MGALMNPLDIVECIPFRARMTLTSCVKRHCAAQGGGKWDAVALLGGCRACPVGAARAEATGVPVPPTTVQPAYFAGLTQEQGHCGRCKGTYRSDIVRGVEESLRGYCPGCRQTSKKQRGVHTLADRVRWLTTSPRVTHGTPTGRSRIASLPPVSD